MNSCISEMPGPEVAVKARAPFHPAPMTTPIEASSSSACTMANLCFLVSGSTRSRLQWRVDASAGGGGGGVGYQAESVAPAETAAGSHPELAVGRTRPPTG